MAPFSLAIIALLATATAAAGAAPPLNKTAPADKLAALLNRTALPARWPPANKSQAIALINEAKTILTDDVANWKLMFAGAAADYTVGPAPNATSPQCSGPTCARIAAMLPLLAFKAKKAVVRCPLDQFQAGACFAPGCAPCDKACPIFAAQPFLLTLPGPFGNGIYCNGRCTPCCQAADDPGRALNSTCVIV